MTPDSTAADAPWTIGRLLTWTCDYFKRNHVEDARLSAEVLLAHVAGCRRIDVYTRFEQVPAPDVLGRFRELVRRAADQEPIAYLVGEKEFYSLPFRVTRDVLIPRPETETLVEAVVDHCRRWKLAAPRLFDFGTGSGCILLSLLKQLPGAIGVGSDVSEPALAIAAENARRLELADRVTFVHVDGPAIGRQHRPADGFDVLVSNPPYVSSAAWPTLKRNIREYEPRKAVTDDADGLTFYALIAREAPHLLAAGGAVFVEIGDDMADAVRGAFESAEGTPKPEANGSARTGPPWRFVGARKDRCTGRDRVMIFTPA